MDDKVKLSTDQCPEHGSPEWEAMADKRADYMAIVGGILWLANVTYFHLAFAASQLARFVSNPGPEHMEAAIRVLIYIRDNPWELKYSPSTDRPLELYIDSDWITFAFIYINQESTLQRS